MTRKNYSPIYRWFLILAGCLSLVVGIIGIFVPVLPTVPLLLLAAACFARSSETFHSWLLNHPRLGPMIRPFTQGEGMPRHAKVKAILLLWSSLFLSVYFLIPIFWVDLLVLGIGVGVSVYLFCLPEKAVVLESSQ